MTRRLDALDRLAGIVLGLLLLAGGLLALEWRLGLVLDLPSTLRTGVVDDVVSSASWPWVFAGVAVALGLLGLRWLLAHLRRPTASSIRLPASDETGRLSVDLGSLASVAADRLEQSAPVTGVHGRTHVVRGRTLIELTAHLDQYADLDDLLSTTGACVREVDRTLTDQGTPTSCRVLISAPRTRRAGRADRVRVS